MDEHQDGGALGSLSLVTDTCFSISSSSVVSFREPLLESHNASKTGAFGLEPLGAGLEPLLVITQPLLFAVAVLHDMRAVSYEAAGLSL